MILAIDVGNTNIVLGVLDGEKLLFSARCTTDHGKTEDEYALIFQGMLAVHGVAPADIEGGILSSVVPVLRTVIPRAVELICGKKMIVVSHTIRTDLELRIDIPSQLGSDLLVDAVAAKSLYSAPIVIFDMGTATTLSVIDKTGAYIGGMILPGMQVAMDSLSNRTAQLPHINFGPPPRLIGANTEECMQAGAVYGWASMMDGLIGRVEKELGQSVTTVLTGGLSSVVAPFCTREVNLQPDLLLLGLRILYDMNADK